MQPNQPTVPNPQPVPDLAASPAPSLPAQGAVPTTGVPTAVPVGPTPAVPVVQGVVAPQPQVLATPQPVQPQVVQPPVSTVSPAQPPLPPQPAVGAQQPVIGQAPVVGMPAVAQPLPNPTQPQTVPTLPSNPSGAVQQINKFGKFGTGIVVVFVLLLTAFNAGWSFHVMAVRRVNYNKQDWVKAVNAQKKFGPDVTDRSDDKLDLSNEVDGRYTVKNQDIKAGMNQQVNMSDGLSFMITSAEKGWKPASSFSKPKAGNYFVKLHMVIGNRNNKDRDAVSFYSTDMQDILPDGKKRKEIVYYIFGSDLKDGEQDLTSLGNNKAEPGEQKDGVIVVEVPSGTSPKIYIERSGYGYARDDKGTTSFKDFTMKAEVDVQ